MKELPVRARIYVMGIMILGALALLRGLWSYHFRDLELFATLGLLGALTAKLKVRLPGVPGTVSIADTFVFATIMLFGPTEAMLMAALCGFIQCAVRPEIPPRAHQTAFSISAIIMAAAVSSWCFEATRASVHYGSLQAQIIGITAAALAYFLVNTLAVSGAISLTSGGHILKIWHQNFLWTAACFFAGATIALLIALYVRHLGVVTFLMAIPPMMLIYYTYRLYLGHIDDNRRHVQKIEEMHTATIEALALAIEAKDQTACDHSRRVQAYAVGLANALNLDAEQVNAIREAALLHDIGKLAVPEYILCKPGHLTPKEFQKVSMHTLVGYQLLSLSNFPPAVSEIVLCHHERWDGAGYPNRLQQEQIPLGARILALADCFEALTVPRHYRKALSVPEATAHILAESGRAFDPKIVELFYPRLEALREQGEAAIAAARQKRSQADPRRTFGSVAAGGADEIPPLSVYEAIGAANKEISALYDLAQAMGTTLRLNETLSMVASKIGHILPSSTIAIYLLENHEMVPRLVEGIDDQIFRGLHIPLGKGIAGWVAENKQPIINAGADLEVAAGNASAVTYLQSSLAVPLMVNDMVIGVLALYDLKPNRFDDDGLRLLDMISGKIAVALRNSIIFEQTHAEALTDPITGLPNSRFLFMRLDQEISRARRNGTSLTVLAMDLDNFKQINDTLGHLIGDKVLIRVSQLLRASLREYDFIARTGGDEFVALLVDADEDAVDRRIETIQQEIAQYKIDSKNDKMAPLGISIGYAVYDKDGQDTDTLLTAADAAMYQLKKERKQLQALAGAERR